MQTITSNGTGGQYVFTFGPTVNVTDCPDPNAVVITDHGGNDHNFETVINEDANTITMQVDTPDSYFVSATFPSDAFTLDPPGPVSPPLTVPVSGPAMTGISRQDGTHILVSMTERVTNASLDNDVWTVLVNDVPATVLSVTRSGDTDLVIETDLDSTGLGYKVIANERDVIVNDLNQMLIDPAEIDAS